MLRFQKRTWGSSMVASSVVSLPVFGSMQGTSASCAWLMSTWGQKWTITSLCIDPLLFPKFPPLASAPNSAWSAPSRTAHWANSCTAVLHLDPDEGLRIQFKRFGFTTKCHLGPTGALRIPLGNFTKPWNLPKTHSFFERENNHHLVGG